MPLELIAKKPRGRKPRYPPEVRKQWMDDKESGMTSLEVCAKYSISPITFRKWYRRYKGAAKSPSALLTGAIGIRKKASREKIPDVVIDEIYRLRETYGWGLIRIQKALLQKFEFTVSSSTVHNYLRKKEGLKKSGYRISEAVVETEKKEKIFLQEELEKLKISLDYYKEENKELKIALREMATTLLYTRKDFLDFVLNRRRKYLDEQAKRKDSQ